MSKSLAEWEQFYRQKTGRNIASKAFAQCLIDLGKGFVYFTFNKDGDLVVCETVGDGRYWLDKLLTIARSNNCKRILTTIFVRPEVYQRRYPQTKVFMRVNDELTIMYMEVT